MARFTVCRSVFIGILERVTNPEQVWPDRGITDAEDYIAYELMKAASAGDLRNMGCPEPLVELRDRIFHAANGGAFFERPWGTGQIHPREDPFRLLTEIVDHPLWDGAPRPVGTDAPPLRPSTGSPRRPVKRL